MKNLTITSFVLIMFCTIASSQPIPPDSLYLGQTPPGDIPQVFAPGIVSKPGRVEYGISISPDGKEMLFAIGNWPDKRTQIMEYKNGSWTGPDTVSFSMTRSAEEAIYSPDGQRVYYYAYSPPNPVGGADLCYSVKPDSVWEEPINLGTPLNTTQGEYHPCVVADGSIYFENASGKICYSKYQNGNYMPRVILPCLFNDQGNAWGNPYVSPDESYFIFNSSRPGGFGGTDLYISYKKEDGTWTNPKNLGNIINTNTSECGSEITDDSLYMTYVSKNDIYWVSSGFIDSLKYTNFKPYLKNPVPDQMALIGQQFDYMIPDTTFLDDDGNNTLTYSAYLTNGDPLPPWMAFDTIAGKFSGTPPAAETLEISITATDTAGADISDIFKIIADTVTGINQIRGQNIKIFPNPTSGTINISFDRPSPKKALIEVCNLEGLIIQSHEFYNNIIIDLTTKPKGIYLIKLQSDNEITVRKVCLQTSDF
jgi:hypothetical protein